MLLKTYKSLCFFTIATIFLIVSGCANAEKGEENQASSDSVGEEVNYEIIGIEPGTGIMDKTKVAFDEYGLNEDWSVKNSTGPVMTAELGNAIQDEKPIIVTGWNLIGSSRNMI